MTALAYRASALASYTTAAAAKNIVIPAAVVKDDVMLLAFAGGAGGNAAAAPSGWAAVPGATGLANGVTADLFYRVAQSGDAGTTVTVAQTTGTRAIVALTAYSGDDIAGPIAVSAVQSETVSSATHAGASLTVPASGGWVARFLYLKDSITTASTTITPPAGTTVRQSQPGNVFTGGAQVSLTIADSNGDVAAGTANGTWTSDGSATSTAIAVGVVIKPVTSTVTVRPVSDITTTGTALVGGASASAVLADDDPNTYVEVPAGTFTVETKLGTLSAAPSQVTVKYYGAGSPASMQVVTSLVQGTTVIGTLGTENAVVTSETTKTYSLTGAQQSACTNLADLRVRQVVTVA